MTDKRYASLTQYDGTAACTKQWISQLYAIPKLGKFVRPLVTRPPGEKEFNLRTLVERRRETKTNQQWARASKEERLEFPITGELHEQG